MSLVLGALNRAKRRRCKHRCLSSTDAPASSSTGASLGCRHPRSPLASKTGSSATLDITSTPDLWPKRRGRLVPYRLDTPTPRAVSHPCRRVVSDCDHERPSLHSRERPVRHALAGASHDVAAAGPIPADPAKQEIRVPFETQPLLLRSHIAVQRAGGASTSGISRDPIGVRSPAARTRWKSRTPAWKLGAAAVSPHRQRPSVRAAKHRKPSEAGHVRGEPKLSSPDHQLLSVASTTSRRLRPELCQLQTGHDRIATWSPTR